MPEPVSFDSLLSRLHHVRGHPVMLHPDLARLYGVSCRQLLLHAERLPGEFCFPLEETEFAGLAGEPSRGPSPVYALTEHGALALAYLLATPEALTAGVPVLRAFLNSREARGNSMAANLAEAQPAPLRRQPPDRRPAPAPPPVSAAAAAARDRTKGRRPAPCKGSAAG